MNPAARRIELSVKTGAGVDEWCDWLCAQVGSPRG